MIVQPSHAPAQVEQQAGLQLAKPVGPLNLQQNNNMKLIMCGEWGHVVQYHSHIHILTNFHTMKIRTHLD